jgi:hypothetical protein
VKNIEREVRAACPEVVGLFIKPTGLAPMR